MPIPDQCPVCFKPGNHFHTVREMVVALNREGVFRRNGRMYQLVNPYCDEGDTDKERWLEEWLVQEAFDADT